MSLLVCRRSPPALALPFPNGQKARRAEANCQTGDTVLKLGSAPDSRWNVREALTAERCSPSDGLSRLLTARALFLTAEFDVL